MDLTDKRLQVADAVGARLEAKLVSRRGMAAMDLLDDQCFILFKIDPVDDVAIEYAVSSAGYVRIRRPIISLLWTFSPQEGEYVAQREPTTVIPITAQALARCIRYYDLACGQQQLKRLESLVDDAFRVILNTRR